MSTPIKRYDVCSDYDGGYLDEAADGRAVKYDDHLASLSAALAKVEELESGQSAEMFLTLTGEITELRTQRDQLAAHLSFAVTLISTAGLGGNAQVNAMRAALEGLQ